MNVLVMGVSGSGKSTVGALLALRLGLPFLDADRLHPPSNLAKLEAGTPLTDADRQPWLEAVRVAWAALGDAVVACSALKRAYREMLLASDPQVTTIYLRGTPDLISRRLGARQGHFASPGILAGQFADLEEPDGAIAVDVDRPAADIVEALVRCLTG